MTNGPLRRDIPHVARRLPGIARRRLPRLGILTVPDPAPEPDLERAAGSTPRDKMREVLSRAGGRGVSITMIVDLLATEQPGVDRRAVRRWLAEDIRRGEVERAGPGFYRQRQHHHTRNQHHGRHAR
jgi:hypothetical protein